MYAKPVIVALCASLIAPAAATARQGGQLTVVAPEKGAVSYQNWSDRTTSRLSRSIRSATTLYRDNNSTGYARVQFRLDEQGRPQDVGVAGSSASSRGIERISMRAIRGMGSLLPLPQEVRNGSRFEAWVIVANDAQERDRMLTSLRAEHRAQTMAMAAQDRPVLLGMR